MIRPPHTGHAPLPSERPSIVALVPPLKICPEPNPPSGHTGARLVDQEGHILRRILKPSLTFEPDRAFRSLDALRGRLSLALEEMETDLPLTPHTPWYERPGLVTGLSSFLGIAALQCPERLLTLAFLPGSLSLALGVFITESNHRYRQKYPNSEPALPQFPLNFFQWVLAFIFFFMSLLVEFLFSTHSMDRFILAAGAFLVPAYTAAALRTYHNHRILRQRSEEASPEACAALFLDPETEVLYVGLRGGPAQQNLLIPIQKSSPVLRSQLVRLARQAAEQHKQQTLREKQQPSEEKERLRSENRITQLEDAYHTASEEGENDPERT